MRDKKKKNKNRKNKNRKNKNRKNKNRKNKATEVPVPRRYGNVPPPIDWDEVEDLGEVSDRTIAARYGVSPQAVCSARTRRNIPPYQPKRRDYRRNS